MSPVVRGKLRVQKEDGKDLSAIIAFESDLYMCQSVMSAISNWHHQRLYLALDTTMLWNRFCMIHISVVCGGRAVPFLWKVLAHNSSTVAFEEYKLMLKLAHRLLSNYRDVMLLADRGESQPSTDELARK